MLQEIYGMFALLWEISQENPRKFPTTRKKIPVILLYKVSRFDMYTEGGQNFTTVLNGHWCAIYCLKGVDF